jgi:hypothetical protein
MRKINNNDFKTFERRRWRKNAGDKKREKSRWDAACTVCRGTRQLQFPQQAGVEAVVAGLGGEEVGLGKELVSARALFEEVGDLILVF